MKAETNALENMVHKIFEESAKLPNRLLDKELNKAFNKQLENVPFNVSGENLGIYPIDITASLLDITKEIIKGSGVATTNTTDPKDKMEAPAERRELLADLTNDFLSALENNGIKSRKDNKTISVVSAMILKDEYSRIAETAQKLYPDDPAFKTPESLSK